MDPARAVVMVVHGSPDVDWLRPFERIIAHARTLDPRTHVRVAALVHEPTVHAVVRELAAGGCHRIAIVSGLLSSGGRHHKDDLPVVVSALQGEFPTIEFETRPGALGDHELVVDAIARVLVGDRGRA